MSLLKVGDTTTMAVKLSECDYKLILPEVHDKLYIVELESLPYRSADFQYNENGFTRILEEARFHQITVSKTLTVKNHAINIDYRVNFPFGRGYNLFVSKQDIYLDDVIKSLKQNKDKTFFLFSSFNGFIFMGFSIYEMAGIKYECGKKEPFW